LPYFQAKSQQKFPAISGEITTACNQPFSRFQAPTLALLAISSLKLFMALAISSAQALVLSHRSRPWRTSGEPAKGLHTLCPDSFLWTKGLLDGYTPLIFYPPLGVIKPFVVVNNWEDKPFPLRPMQIHTKSRMPPPKKGNQLRGK